MIAKRHRGVLLLIVLALLAMFAMVAVAFVVMTRTNRLSAERSRTIDAVLDSPEKTLQQAFNVVVRGTPINTKTLAPTTSAITWQSLLEKIYGYETIGSLNLSATMANVTPFVSSPTNPGNGQLIEFTLPKTAPDPTTLSIASSASIDPFHYVGCVVTMLSGSAAGLSSRIVGINPNNLNVQMLCFESGLQPKTGDQYIVNGFPYSGMGFGFNPNSGALNMPVSISTSNNLPMALLPNSPPKNWAQNWTPTGGTNSEGIIPGGVNSDYTAADNQDPLLALAIATTSGGISVPIPSLHRSDLLQHIGAVSSTGAIVNADLLRMAMFRPNSFDHPLFTGSNPGFNPAWDGFSPGTNTNGAQWQWDVDNDGDGIPDSVWVDLGLPVRYTSDGRAYKPLFAILCLDMDGRLNLNAHGNLAQSNSAYYQQMLQNGQAISLTSYNLLTSVDTGVGATPGTSAYFAAPAGFAQTTATIPLTRGLGTGVAEVNLLPLFREPRPPATASLSYAASFYWSNFQAVLTGNSGIMGRYGSDFVPGISGSGSLLTFNNAFPYSGVLGGNYWSNFPTAPNSVYDAFGSPPDPQGMGTIGLDRAGRPLYISSGGTVANGPHDIDLTHRAAHNVNRAYADNPFGPAEFESILRYYDRDAATLPQRLANLTNTGSGCLLPARRAEFTTESNMVPVASGVLPPTMRGSLPNLRSSHPIDIFYNYLAANNVNANPQTLATQLLPWELIEGLKMDLNRPFGAGALSTSGALIQGGTATIPDQPGMSGEFLTQYINGSGGTATAAFNYAADGAAASDSLAARQLYARHLYVLTLLLADTNAMLKGLQKSNSGAVSADVNRLLAQWAVNVVAYRDHNNIMIPFVYDPNPFSSNGWRPNSNADPTFDPRQYTVWGCKRPELLITETLAFHDRRTQDLADEVVNPNKPGRYNSPPSTTRTKPGTTADSDPAAQDPGFNSRFRPQGSLFVELYNPWTSAEVRTTDLGPIPSSAWPNGGVQLDKVTPTVNGQCSPVWRLVIVDPSLPQNAPPSSPATTLGDELPDPDNPVFDLPTQSFRYRPSIERAAYFVSLMTPGMTTDRAGSVSYSLATTSGTPTVVPPSGYAVIGSADPIGNNSDPNQRLRSYIGFATGQTTGGTSNRMITLNSADFPPSPTAIQPPVCVAKNTGDPSAPSATTANVPVLVAVDTPQRLSVSEPVNGYPPYENDPSGNSVSYSASTGQYAQTLDIPVDQVRAMAPFNEVFNNTSIWQLLNTNGTIPAFRIIYLQRLADPTRPWASDTSGSPQTWNPYRTVDAMTMDLTTFNGLTNQTDPSNVTVNSGFSYHFESHQRGDRNYLVTGNTAAYSAEMNLWKQEPALKGTISTGTLQWSGGWTAAGWDNGVGASAPSMSFSNALNQSLGYLNKPYGVPASSPAIGDPQYPFPWLNWSYRPFNNVYELMLVPTVSSSRLMGRNMLDPRRNFGYLDDATRSTTVASTSAARGPQDVYDSPSSPQFPMPPPPVPAVASPPPQVSNQVPYPHLLNFFESEQSSGPLQTSASLSSQLHRIFDYVGVPSRFANTQLQIQPVYADSATNPHYFHTPYNRISRYQEPGHINLNTVTSSDVLLGAMNMNLPPLVRQYSYELNPIFWDKFVRSRGGMSIAASNDVTSGTVSTVQATQDTLLNMLEINPAYPSRFMQPFRTSGGAFLSAPTISGSSTETNRETDVSLLRGDPGPTPPNATANPRTVINWNLRPLFEIDDGLLLSLGGSAISPLSRTPLPTPDNFAITYPCLDPSGTYAPFTAKAAPVDYNRNPFFRYQAIQKLGSVASTHSNVFSVWITVGYFQVMPASNPTAKDSNGNLIYPDGFQLGAELGSDSGDIVRHRAFYLFDRSIPVGFLRGHDLNQDKATLLKRFIE